MVLHQLTERERVALVDCLPAQGIDWRHAPDAPYQPAELSGASARFSTLAEKLRPLQPELSTLLDRLAARRAPTVFRHARGTLSLERPLVMGVINVTPDSFSDGGRCLETDAAIAHGLRLAAQGANMLDVGGESTRPGAAPVSEAEECARILPVIQALAERTDLPISVDTAKSAVAARALGCGAAIVNDVTGFQGDPQMAAVAAEHQAGVVLMHLQGRPESMQLDPSYTDVLYEVTDYWRESLRLASEAGIDAERILLDPGIGFGKSLAHNLELLRRLPELASLGHGLLLGTSRKSFIRSGLEGLWNQTPPDGCSQTEAEDRVWGTAASVACAVASGVAAIRVHDVAEMRQVADLAFLITSDRERN